MGLLGILVALAANLDSVSRLERASARSSRRDPGSGLGRGATARPLDANLHGKRCTILDAVLPDFLLGALFGKLMEDSGSVSAIASFMAERLGPRRAVLSVVLAGALVTYGGVSLFVAFFVLAPMAHALFRAAAIPKRLMPAAIALGTSTFTMSALPGTPAIQNAIPMPFFGTTPFAAPGLGIIASIMMLGFGLWWLARAEASARKKGEGYGTDADLAVDAPENQIVRKLATTSGTFDPAEVRRGHQSDAAPVHRVGCFPTRHRGWCQSLNVAVCTASPRCFLPC